jgi:hypothetical protein
MTTPADINLRVDGATSVPLAVGGPNVRVPGVRLVLVRPNAGVVQAVGVTADTWRVERRGPELTIWCDAPVRPAAVREVTVPALGVTLPVGARLTGLDCAGVASVRVRVGQPALVRRAVRWARGWRCVFKERAV